MTVTVTYCHDCSYYSIKYLLQLNGIHENLVSVPSNENFVITLKSVPYTISVKNMTIEYEGKTEKVEDVKILLKSLHDKSK